MRLGVAERAHCGAVGSIKQHRHFSDDLARLLEEHNLSVAAQHFQLALGKLVDATGSFALGEQSRADRQGLERTACEMLQTFTHLFALVASCKLTSRNLSRRHIVRAPCYP
jgi:hypothetical protein